MSKHIPYKIDDKTNRRHFYETNWKIVALDLLERHEKNVEGLSVLDFGSGRILRIWTIECFGC